jgi:hypothetical protein
MQLLRVALAVLATIAMAPVLASEPLTNDVATLLQANCSVNNLVPKRWLAAAILDQTKVRAALAERLDEEDDARVLSPAEYLLTKDVSVCGPGTSACNEDDRKAVSAAQSEADYIIGELSSSTGTKFARIGDFKTGTDYFRNPGAQISCEYSTDKTPEKNQPTSSTARALRIRSKAEDLYVSSSDDSYKALKTATLSYDQDDVTHKRTRSAVGDIGYAIPLPINSTIFRQLDIVPYFGIDDELSKSAGSKASVKANTRTFGIMADTSWVGGITNYLALSPSLISDLQHNSKLFTTTVYYQPVMDRYLNSNRELGTSPLFFQFILNGQIHHGHYTDDGDLKPTQAGDYDRLGGTVGFSILTNSKDSPFPFAWTTTKSLYRGDGRFATIGKFDSTLSFGFGPGEIFAWSISYDHGRDVDTALLQHEWKIALGIKY